MLGIVLPVISVPIHVVDVVAIYVVMFVRL